MCRWFAYISPNEDCLLDDVLIRPPHSLSKQVNSHYLPMLMSHDPNNITTAHEISVRNRLLNVDGFGVAWYTKSFTDFNSGDGWRPALYKNKQPPEHDLNFSSICANTATRACVAHIRAATATAVTEVNNHPFVFGRHTIMHNGVITSFSAIARHLVPLLSMAAYSHIAGSTDSEHFAALYITYLTDSSDDLSTWEASYSVSAMKTALHKAIGTIIDLQMKYLDHKTLEANSLNVCVTDGSKLVAVRFRNHETEQPPSLYYSEHAGVTLNRKYPGEADGSANPDATNRPEDHGKHVIIASEPTTHKQADWTVVPKNRALVVEEDGEVSLIDVPCPKDWMATAMAKGF